MSEEVPQRKIYKTSSITLAATLVHEKMRLTDLEPIMTIMRRGHDLFYFIFADEDRRPQMIMDFSNNVLMVVPTTFMEIVRQLKQRTKEYAANSKE